MEQLVKTIKILLRYLYVIQPSVEIIQDDNVDLVTLVIRDHLRKSLFIDDPNVAAAFSIVVREVIEKNKITTTVVVDYDGSKLKTIKETKDKALIARQRVLHYGKPYTFLSLNAFERFLIHQYLSLYEDIITKSFGEKNDRILVVSKK
jgi:predicted RNA-binding protein Jag